MINTNMEELFLLIAFVSVIATIFGVAAFVADKLENRDRTNLSIKGRRTKL